MIIEKLNIGAHTKTLKYAVCADATETGDRPQEIARFDTLEEAAIVLRYMNGGQISEDDEQRAKEAIKKVDAPTDQSRRDHQAN